MVTAARRLNAGTEFPQGARIDYVRFHMITLKKVNKTLQELGAQEILVKGEGYYYFTEGNSYNWETSSVMVMSLNELSLQEWIAEWKSLSGNS